MRRLLIALVLVLPATTHAHDILVGPYLQQAAPTSVRVLWETDESGPSVVEWGTTDQLGEATPAMSAEGHGPTRIHTAILDGLLPATRHHYRVVTGTETSDVFDFMTPAEADAEASFRLIAMSDMQRDAGNPDAFRSLVEDGVIPFVSDRFSADLAAELAFTLVPGDLVDFGPDHPSWASSFFGPSRRLNRHVPLYPVPGNHEADTDFFFRYFDLPTNGTTGFEEHWWFHDHGNLRIVGLDSNGGYRTDAQLNWLDGVLADACVDPTLDFVFAQLHHPFKSELWLPGEIDYSGDIVSRLESFSTDCGKPSIHFFGHTHGYSRGQSRDHSHLWVNVATAGGNIDYWGEYPQADYAEFSVSEDEYGFVVVEVDAGDAPQFRLRRVSRGDENTARPNVVTDDVTVRSANTPPATPFALAPAAGDTSSPEKILLVASLFADPDGDAQGAAHWQIDRNCSFSSPLLDRWVQHENRYGDEDLQAGVDLGDLFVERLPAESELCWRVRHRDRGLVWSAWSVPTEFRTSESTLGANLLINPGAEDELTGWTARLGNIESLRTGECDAGAPRTGERYFAVGGVCANEAERGEAFQSVPLNDHLDAVVEERVSAHLSGWFADWNGNDRPTARLVFRDVDGFEIGRTAPIGSTTPVWTEATDVATVPPETVAVEVVLVGERNAGTDNDSYFDDLSLQLRVEPPEGDDDDSAGDDDDAADDDDSTAPSEDGCGCSTGGTGAPWTMTAGLLAVLRRRRRSTVRNSDA